MVSRDVNEKFHDQNVYTELFFCMCHNFDLVSALALFYMCGGLQLRCYITILLIVLHFIYLHINTRIQYLLKYLNINSTYFISVS